MVSKRLARLFGRPVYYGWPMLVAVSSAQVVSWGILYYAFSVFVAPMQAERGWTTVELTGAYSLALLCSGLAAVPVGRWLDRHGPRALMTVGSILFSGVTMTVHVIPYLTSHGHSAGFAATVAGLFGLMSLVGRMTIAPLAERVERRWVTTGLIAMQLVGLAVLVVAGKTAAGALIYVALFGAGSGVLTIMRAALLAEHYGPANYGTINGAQNLALTGARTVAPVGAGLLVGVLGGYDALLWGLVGLLALGGGAVLAASDPTHALASAAAD